MQQAYCARSIALKAIIATIVNKKPLKIVGSLLVNKKDLSLAKSLAFSVIRYYHQLNNIVNSHLKTAINRSDLDVHAILLLGAYQILFSRIPNHAAIFQSVELSKQINKLWAKPLINAVLHKIAQQAETALEADDYSHPSWLVKKIKQAYPDDYLDIFAQNNKQAPMTLRVHPAYSLLDYQSQLLDHHIASDTIDNFAQALVLKQAVEVDKLPHFAQGACYVQDACGQLAAPLLNPQNNERILDACASPGGKTLHLLELAPKATIIALESDAKRLVRLQANIAKHATTPIQTLLGLAQQKDWWDGQLFDKILLDVPCSGTGVIRRHPDIKLLKKPRDVKQLTQLQADILGNVWQMLKPNGTLLYATCSILPVENSQQMADFLSKYLDAQEIKIPLAWGRQTLHGRQQIPHQHFDGFYYCLLQKGL